MRETRMTFGEHLEELRTRLIHCIIYLVIGLIVSFFFGEELMELTLGPHKEAIQGALRERLVGRMEANVAVLDRLRTGDESLKDEAVQLSPDDIQWEVLFIHDVAVPHLTENLRQPFTQATASLDNADGFSTEQKASLKGILTQLGENLSTLIAGEFSTGLEVGRFTNVMDRLHHIDDLLGTVEAEANASEAQVVLGLGKDMGGVREQFREFMNYLELRQSEATEKGVSLVDLRARVQNSKLPAFLDRVLTKLEDNAEETINPAGSGNLIVIHYLESFMAYLKVALIFGLGLSLPLILYEMWKFVGAGLHSHEQKYVVVFLPFSLGLFLTGTVFGYFAMIPMGLRFLASWGVQDVNLSFTLGNYIALFFTLTLLMGLVFQIPLVMVFLSLIDVVRVDAYRRARKLAIFFGFCGAAIITPPDPFTLLLMAGPLVLLYELGIIVSQLLTGRRKKTDSEESKA